MADRGTLLFIAVVLLVCTVPALVALEPVNQSMYYPYQGPGELPVLHELPPTPVESASGTVIFIGNGSERDVYVKLGSNETTGYTLEAGPLVQGNVTIDVPVNWTQSIVVNATQNTTVNLWNHNASFPDSFLSDVQKMSVVLDGEVVSQVPIFEVPEGVSNVTITYETPAVHRQITCMNETVKDLLPPGATLISSDLPLDTYVQRVCRIRLYHESHTPYANVRFSVPEIPRADIVSIYSVEQHRYLYFKNGSLYVPGS